MLRMVVRAHHRFNRTLRVASRLHCDATGSSLHEHTGIPDALRWNDVRAEAGIVTLRPVCSRLLCIAIAVALRKIHHPGSPIGCCRVLLDATYTPPLE